MRLQINLIGMKLSGYQTLHPFRWIGWGVFFGLGLLSTSPAQSTLVQPASVQSTSAQSASVQIRPSFSSSPIPVQGCQNCFSPLSQQITQPYQQAVAYAMRQGGNALLILEGGEIIVEQYDNGYTARKPHPLKTATQSFTGILAIAAAQDRLLTLDEPVAKTITEWQSHPLRSKITIRQLLSLTSGLSSSSAERVSSSASNGMSNVVPTYSQAIKSPLTTVPGKVFQYGSAPFQIFGELLRRKLAPRNQTPLAYLKRKIFDRMDLDIGGWELDADGNPNLASGASLTARDWARFGKLLERHGRWNGRKILDKKLLAECYLGSSANAAYGLGLWLNEPGRSPSGKPQNLLAAAPKDTIMAAGTDDQRLYVMPSRNLVVVRFGRDNRFEDDTFLSLLLQ